MKLLRRPISASDWIPDRFCVISMEFLSLSRRRSSSWNVSQRRWARRNVCRSQANVSSARESKCERRSSRSLRIKEWPNTRTEGTEEAMEMNKRLEQSEKKGWNWYPRSENNTAMNCNRRSVQRPKWTGNNKRKARSEKQNTTTKIGGTKWRWDSGKNKNV